MKLGCHCVLFGPAVLTDTEATLRKLKEAGADGAEVGSRFLAGDKAPLLVSALEKSGMELSGYHISHLLGNLVNDWDLVNDSLVEAIAFAKEIPCNNILFTGMPTMDMMHFEESFDPRLRDADFLQKVAFGMERLAQTAKEKGVLLHYHNHSWEFDGNGLLFHTLGEFAPSLYFALDIGWASISGADVPQLLNQYAGRISYLHLRDYKKSSPASKPSFMELREGFCPLGQGDAFHWPALWPQIEAAAGPRGWAVVEYETGDADARRYREALDFIKSLSL